MRMQLAGLVVAAGAAVLWVNTGVLIADQLARPAMGAGGARSRRLDGVRCGIAAGGGARLRLPHRPAIAWRQLAAAAIISPPIPANSFFYLITAVHGLHVLGGLVALGRAAIRVVPRRDPGKLRLSVDLCAIYWHFLLFVWLVLFAPDHDWK